MNKASLQTPGVYITEQNAFGGSVVQVATAVPAFIGYTPKAAYGGKSYTNLPQKISSFAEFQAIYCLEDATGLIAVKQYFPQYYLVPQAAKPESGNYVLINNVYYLILPDPNTCYYLYNSIRLFYENGGGDAYIVSVGGYGQPSGRPLAAGAPVINQHVKLADLETGLTLLMKVQEVTMYICPEATLLSQADNAAIMQAMLLQNGQMQTAVSVFDVPGGKDPNAALYTNDIDNFRQSAGNTNLSFGTAYYPFACTTITGEDEFDYTNFFGGDASQLEAIINPASNPDPALASIFSNINSSSGTIAQNQNALLNASSAYTNLYNLALADVNILPPSGAMAGIMTMVDISRGVWVAPANVGVTGAVSLPLNLTNEQQAGLTVDPISGKSINALREFPMMGVMVWGARTLDGNSLDWRYLPVVRTMVMIEQSCKLALLSLSFMPDTSGTWAYAVSMISSFLESLWKQGALQGSSPATSYSVSCGLGLTMNAEDIFNNLLIVSVKVAVVHPAEFIEFTVQQQLYQA
ncbi:MAG TPA: phage tail sheath C-terminal domain-containing protein [Chitinophagaceae bacterium]|nr:phage tail sheath C-terminal domain-containing protein [Chitinophagaceae bacterium]